MRLACKVIHHCQRVKLWRRFFRLEFFRFEFSGLTLFFLVLLVTLPVGAALLLSAQELYLDLEAALAPRSALTPQVDGAGGARG